MNTPASALTWEIWRRHKSRLTTIALVILSFALLYPKLCALMGLDMNSPNALDVVASTASERFKNASDIARIGQVLGWLLMLLGPVGCMVMSLLYVIWIFTFAQLDAKKGFGFPGRIFTLPVSTNFIAAWFLATGAIALFLVYAGWTFLVRLPKVDVFDGYPNFLAWVTLMVVAQAVMWALDGFAGARCLLLCGVVSGFAFLTGPALRDYPWLVQNEQLVLLTLLTVGGGVAFVGLGKIRQGAWQRWPWGWRAWKVVSADEQVGEEGRLLDGRKRQNTGAVQNLAAVRSPFRSPGRAQFWFEWRSHMGGSLLFVGGLSGAALMIMAVVAARVGTLSEGDTVGLTLVLLGVPLFIHFVYGISPRGVTPFTAIRPQTCGEMVMARLKAAALSTVLCWAGTFVMLAIVPMLGDVRSMLDHLPLHVQPQRFWPVLILSALGLVFITWRFVAADLCLVCVPKTWLAKAAILKFYGAFGLVWLVSYVANDTRYEATLRQVLSVAFAFLILLKMFLAQWAFRACLKRQLLARAAMLKYLIVWSVVTAGLVVPTLVLFHDEQGIMPIALGIVLLVPLARVGFAPMALSIGRHG